MSESQTTRPHPTTSSYDGAPALLDVRDLEVIYRVGLGRPPLHAVDGVSFSVAKHETMGLVGESGSGKTTIGRAILGLAPVSGGSICFDGVDITHAGYKQRRAMSAHLQVVFQDPYSSLSPTRTIGQTLGETLRAQKTNKQAVAERIDQMLERVGLTPDAARRYPSRFSGGQRQRIAIARALMAQPRLVICDEPASALDLSVQAQVLNLLRELQNDFGLSYLFIAHDLAVVRYVSHRIIVIYRGRIMEQGDAASVYESPIHPYTRELLAAAPVPDPDEQRERRSKRAGRAAVPDIRVLPNSCPFSPRCPHVIDICRTEKPSLDTTPGGSLVACHRWPELIGKSALTVTAPSQAQN
jgi:oligopeptide/dipeptide ABC transporter ATP-binding protein